jgi:hypothetical protein
MKEVLQYLNIAAVFVGFAIYAYFADKREGHHRDAPRKGGGGFYGGGHETYRPTEKPDSSVEHYIA